MDRRLRIAGSVVAIPVVGIVVGRLLGFQLGLHTVVRCRQGHLFETIWIPGVKLKAIDLGVARVQWCPVGRHWTLVVPVRGSDLSETQREEAAHHRDLHIP